MLCVSLNQLGLRSAKKTLHRNYIAADTHGQHFVAVITQTSLVQFLSIFHIFPVMLILVLVLVGLVLVLVLAGPVLDKSYSLI